MCGRVGWRRWEGPAGKALKGLSRGQRVRGIAETRDQLQDQGGGPWSLAVAIGNCPHASGPRGTCRSCLSELDHCQGAWLCCGAPRQHTIPEGGLLCSSSRSVTRGTCVRSSSVGAVLLAECGWWGLREAQGWLCQMSAAQLGAALPRASVTF